MRFLLVLYLASCLGGNRLCKLFSGLQILLKSLLHSSCLLSCRVDRPNLARQSQYGRPGQIIDITLFCTLPISSLRYLGNELWKTCALYSRTGHIVTQRKLIKSSDGTPALLKRTRNYRRLFTFLIDSVMCLFHYNVCD